MELHCLPTETPTSASSCSTDPLYDNCPPFAQRERARKREMESRDVCPAVTRLPAPRSPLPCPAPAAAKVQTVVGGGRGPGTGPDHSYSSCTGGLGRRGWGSKMVPGINSARGGEEGGGLGCGTEDRAHPNQSPSPSQSEEHRSALSLYDNLPDAAANDSLRDFFDMETGLQAAWTPERTRGMMEGDDVSEGKSSWSSCEIVLAKSRSSNQDQDKEREQGPEPDSGSCEFMHPHLPVPNPQGLTQSSPELCRAMRQAPWPPAGAQLPKQSSWPPRVPPPVPLADPSASALRSLLTSLQQQIVRQREEYEARVASLEQRNEDLEVEVARLKTNLAQQRQWYQAVQAKIVECERARADAEARNATLQREMDQFFDTFGELNNEAKKTEYIVKSF